uniref:Uncharacterized protein n=1 Tax=Tanacetum cinerariifolium TaxID=118510 RepID=A0A6L2KC08_TANCI|nr:hypothetical protein [Tanacetum cinerariifolium]
MTRSIVKRLTKPLDEPEREFRRLRKAAMRSHQNESLAIAGRNLFDDEASSSNNTRAKLPTPPKTLHEHSHPHSSRLKNEDPLRHVKHYLSIVDNIQAEEAIRDTSRKLDQFTQFCFSSLTEEEGWNQIEEYIKYQDDLWDEPSHSMNVSSILEVMQPTLKERLKRACNQISFLETPTQENNPSEHVCMSEGDIYNDPSLLRFY